MSKHTANAHVAEQGNAYSAGDHPRRGGRKGGCCKRFWCLWLVLTVVIVLIVVLPIVFVGIPHMAQSQINKSTLEIKSQNATNATPNSIELSVLSVANSSSSLHPTMEAFPAGLYVNGQKDTPFGILNFPELKVEASNTVSIQQNMSIANMDQFIAYNKLVIESETFEIGIAGKTKLHQSGFPAINVDYTKTITMNGLNKLNGFKIESFNISLAGFSDGSNLQGVVYIQNPSVLSIALGNVSLNLAVGDTALGYSIIPDMTLNPGDNRFNMSSYTNTSAVIGLLSKYPDMKLPITITGNSSVNSQGQHLPYYEAAIKANTMSTTLDVSSALGSLGGMLGGGL